VKREIELLVNGERREVYIDPVETLLFCLRERLGLMGTKEGCGDGECGACTVLIDGQPRHACLTLVGEVEGRSITTIEGLVEDGHLHPLQEAFIALGAVQCGFCTPGVLMTAKALLDRNPRPIDTEIRQAIAGNLCRCTGYAKIVEAIHAAARGTVPETPLAGLGVSIARRDALDKVTGRALFGADVSRPHQLWGALVRSAVPHARVVSIDASAALALPGVAGIVTGAELPADLYYGVDMYDQQVFARDKVRYIGEPLATLAAETPELAAHAAALVRVEYEELPGVHSLDDALAPDAAAVHEHLLDYEAGWDAIRYGNVCSETHIERGGFEEALAGCDHVFTHTFETQIIHQTYIEPHASLAEAAPDGKVTIWTTNQKPFAVRRYMAHALGWPMTRIRVIGMHIGGGFGGKLELGLEPYCALLAKKTGRPVKMVMSRHEEFIGGNPRHASRITVTTGVNDDMTIVCRGGEVQLDTGAFSGNGPTAVGLAMFLLLGPYRVKHVNLVGRAVYTNKPSSGSCRGPGGPQAVFAGESQIDIIAREMGWYPLEFRLANLAGNGDIVGAGQRLANVGLRECLETAAEAIGWNDPTLPGQGRGLACSWWTSGGWATAAQVNLNEDGTVTLVTGAVDIGPGAKFTSMPQMVAEELELPVDSVIISSCDTDSSPYDHGDGGSRMTYNVGMACKMAAAELRTAIIERAALISGIPASQLHLVPGAVARKDTGGTVLTLSRIAEESRTSHRGPLSGQASFLAELPPAEEGTYRGLTYPAFLEPSFSAQAAQVQVDQETGRIEVEKIVAAMDVGRAINPRAVEGQLEGGVTMGLGYGLMEEVKMEGGKVLNPDLLDYKIPTAPDVPGITTVIVEHPSAGPHGVKGVGEPPASLPGAVLANALADATGLRLFRLPLTAEAVRVALEEEWRGGDTPP
jgi:CO/xanthine dehydrogenase Mo-binding subunit/aerobic-type carbon monoxide dehydrogenase small subunit (CoxS/CutS family)